MEKVGKKPLGEPVDKKRWVILFSAFGVVIVGLIIAIIAVAANRGDGKPVSEEISEYDKAFMVYSVDNSEVATTIANQNLNSEQILGLIKEKIDTATDEMAKAMFEEDYYSMMVSVYGIDVDAAKKEEILNGLMRADGVLKTASSAVSVANVALIYNNQEIWEKYRAIAKQRDPNIEDIQDAMERIGE